MTAEPAKISVASAVARILAEQGASQVFGVAGGASLHLIHAITTSPDLNFRPLHHEQSVAMAADGFSRSSGNVGVAVATSGPGATNLVTGIAGAFYDSIPVVFITGQVSTTRMKGETGVRQIGFQETPITEIVQPITKATYFVRDKREIRLVMEEAFATAKADRPGPVLIDIPDDIQRELVEYETLQTAPIGISKQASISAKALEGFRKLLAESARPVVIGGAGIILAKAESEFKSFVERFGAPTVLTWGAAHLLQKNHPQRIGLFGTHGARGSNFVVQNADLVISIGSRLDTKATGSPVTTFARGARKVVVDVDFTELAKFRQFGLDIDLPIRADATDFLTAVANEHLPVVSRVWWDYCKGVVEQSQKFDRANRNGPGISPYDFFENLSSSAPKNSDLFVDTGSTLAWFMDSFVPSGDQRIFHDFNNTAMGWALPAALGGHSASPERTNICVVGDGSLMMSLHDLTSLAATKGCAKLVLIDNSGYSMIRQTQDQWLSSCYEASSPEGGLVFPAFEGLAKASGFQFLEAATPDEMESMLTEFWDEQRPVFLRVVIDEAWRVTPQVKFGRPNEDMEPLLPRDQFRAMMKIEPHSASA